MATRNIWAKRVGSAVAWSFYQTKRIGKSIAIKYQTHSVGDIHNLVVRKFVAHRMNGSTVSAIQYDVDDIKKYVRKGLQQSRELQLYNRAFVRHKEMVLTNEINTMLTLISTRIECIEIHLQQEREN